MTKQTKEIPAGVMHEPSVMAWAQLTTTREHAKGKTELSLIEALDGTTHNPLPISKATTLLRRAYPYIFDCAAYVLTHYPERVKEGEFYKTFSIPAEAFYRYCLDDCLEQKDYLKKEIYELLLGEKSKAKYIRVSSERTVLSIPVIIALSHTNLKTGKDERIKNIDQNKKVDKIEIQILKELMAYDRGYLNVPRAFYAKTRRVYERMKKNIQPILDNKNDFWPLIKSVKSIATGPINTEEAARVASIILAQSNILFDLEQGGFHKVYLALEYILVNRKHNAKRQTYELLKLCDKCAPEYTQETNGQLYFKDKKTAFRFSLLIGGIVKMFDPASKKIIGIERVDAPGNGDFIKAIFSNFSKEGNR
jgi:hypothetical protein